MSRDSIWLRTAAVSIVYGWVGLLLFALAAASIHRPAHPGSPSIQKPALASSHVARH